MSFPPERMAMRRSIPPAIRRTASLVLLALVAAGAVWWALGRRQDAPAVETALERLDVYGRVPAFTLTERSGRRVGLDDLRGLVWVVDFIYTDCTDTCPTQSLQLSRLQEEFARANDFRLVSITVDPEHDTPEVLRGYAARYTATDRWWFLTGDRRTIYCLATRGFRLSVVDPATSEPLECGAVLRLGPRRAWAHHGSGTAFMHSARAVLVDREARIRSYHLATDPESLRTLRANLRRLLDGRTAKR